MKKEELQIFLENHKKWLNNKTGGVRADLRGADLKWVDLRGENLQKADLQEANLQGTDLQDADLRGANLQGAHLDYSCLSLWCGSLGVHFDDKQIIQLLYHVLRNVKFSKNVSQELKDKLLTDDLLEIANRFHRVGGCGRISK